MSLRSEEQQKHVSLFTLLGFLSSMNFPVVTEGCTIKKGFATFLTLVWFLSSVSSLIRKKIFIMGMLFATFYTLIGNAFIMDFFDVIQGIKITAATDLTQIVCM